MENRAPSIVYLDNNERIIPNYNTYFYLTYPTLEELQEQEYIGGFLPYRPLISILLPVYNPPIEFFKLTLDSVINQITIYF